jgi:ADP-ribosylglycohydrolase
MLIETAVGDAYGLGWEFAPDQKAPNDLSAYQVNPRYPEFPAARYTDDTMRSLANASVVLGPRSGWYDPAAYARAYQAAYAADGREGWSRGFQAYLERNRDASPLQFMLGLRRRATNGAVMGVAPLGFLPHESFVRMAATAQCVSTHSGAAASSAQAVALAAHYLLHDKGPKHDLEAYLEQEVDWASDEERVRILCQHGSPAPVPAMPAWTIAAGAISVVTDGLFTGMADRLRFAIERGGDTDSLGAVVMALCSCAESIPDDLPAHLVDGVENEAGRAMLRDVDRQLREFAGLQTPDRGEKQ